MSAVEQTTRKPPRMYLRRGHPFTRGLVAAWPFFEGAGTDIHDISGRNQTGVGTSAVESSHWTTDPFGAAFDFGAGSTASKPHFDIPMPPVDGSTNRTVCGWVNHNTTGIQIYFSYGEDNNGERWTFRNDDPQIRIEISGSGYTSTLGVNTGEVSFIACVLDGSTLGDHTFYRGNPTDGWGSDTATGSGSVNTSTTPGDAGIGNHDFYSNPQLDAIMSGWLFYNRALSENELKHISENPLAPYIVKPR